MYPPPYWTGSGWAYATPWLWYDGNKHGSYDYANWASRISSRMSRPSPITQTMWGTYNGATRQGTINIKFRNDSTASIAARLIACVTEDSCYYVAPNGDNWHNHVARDYLPDQNGTVVTIPARDSTTLTRAFTLAAAWRSNYCHIVAFAQSDVVQPDTTKNVYQGGDIRITQLLQVEEEVSTAGSAYTVSSPVPNPFSNRTAICFTLALNSGYTLTVFDVSGRHIRTISGVASGRRNEAVIWDRTDQTGKKLPSGVYLYRFTSAHASDQGKVIVK